MEHEVKLVGSFKNVEKAIYGEQTEYYGERDFNAFRKNAIKEIQKMVNVIRYKGEKYDERLVNDLINYLNNVTIVEKDNNEFWKAVFFDFIENVDKHLTEIEQERNIKDDNLEFSKNLAEILDIYTDKEWRDEPLDSDEVAKLTEHLRNKLDLINGNITNSEYNLLEEQID